MAKSTVYFTLPNNRRFLFLMQNCRIWSFIDNLFIPMKKFTILFLLIYSPLFSSNYIPADSSRKNFIGIQPTRMVINEIGLYYQRAVSSKVLLGLYGAYIYPNHAYDVITVGFGSSPVLFYKGISVSALFKMESKKPDWYSGFYLNYKYRSFEKQDLWHGGLSGSAYAISEHLSRFKTTIKLEYLFGYSPMRRIIDFYIGAGFQLIIINQYLFRIDSDRGYIDRSLYGRSRLILPLPSLSFVFNLGKSW